MEMSNDGRVWALTKVLPQIKDNLEKQALLPVSHSKLNLLLTCPKAFEYAYLNRIERKDADMVEDTNVGTFIHEVLEQAVPALLMNRKLNSVVKIGLDLDLIWAHVLNNEKKRPLTSIELDKAESMREATYAIAERMVDFLVKNNLDVEVEFYIGLDKSLKSFKKQHFTQTFISGYIDLFGISAKNPTCLLVDYKTYSRTNDTDAKITDQLNIYAILTFLKYPHLQSITAGIAYVPDNFIVTNPIERGDLPKLLTEFEHKIHKAIHTLRTERGTMKPGVHCKWCSYKYACSAANSK